MIKKLILVRGTDTVGAYFTANISEEVLKIDIEEDEDIVHDNEEGEEGDEDEEEEENNEWEKTLFNKVYHHKP